MEDNKIMCTVEMDGKVTQSDDFVAILSKENGDAAIFYNTDALTLGMAMKIYTVTITAVNECEEERAEITDVLGSAFIADKPVEVPHE